MVTCASPPMAELRRRKVIRWQLGAPEEAPIFLQIFPRAASVSLPRETKNKTKKNDITDHDIPISERGREKSVNTRREKK